MFWSKSQLFTSSGTFTTGPNTSLVLLMMVGGGASGISNHSGGSGIAPGYCGGTGELVINLMVPVSPSTAYTVTVGAGGVSPSTSAHSANAGGDSSFGTWKALGCPAYDDTTGSTIGLGGGCAAQGQPTDTSNARVFWLPRYETPNHVNGMCGGQSLGISDTFPPMTRAFAAFTPDAFGTPGTNGSSPFTQAGHCGGGTLWGHGGNGGNGGTGTAGGDGTGYGCGGGANGTVIGGTDTAGAGFQGAVWVFYN
jgi:hypothetical protein